MFSLRNKKKNDFELFSNLLACGAVVMESSINILGQNMPCQCHVLNLSMTTNKEAL